MSIVRAERLRPRRPAAYAIVASLLGLLLVAGCVPGTSPAPSAPPSPVRLPPVTRSPAPSSSPEPSGDASAQAGPRRDVVRLGTVTDKRSRRASGSGPAELRFTRGGDFGVVARIDCSRCRGPVSLTAPGRNKPWGTTTAPSSASYLVDLTTDTAAKQELWLDTQGRWSVTVLSWNQLTPVTGRRTGKGSTVLYLADRGSGLKVTFRPRDRTDSFGVRLVSASGDSRLFGESEAKALNETYDVDLPAVIAIQTRGSWTLAPR